MKAIFYTLAYFAFVSSALAEVQTGGVQTASEDPSQILIDERASAILRHNPSYFVYGEPLSKLQMSFKVPIVRDVPLFFGFTQFTFWALKEKSKPFRDLTYNPELFYRWTNQNWKTVDSIDFGILSHTSNGKTGQDSRSYEKNYLRFNFEQAAYRWKTRLSLQFSYLHTLDYTNHDITEYISPVTVNLSFRQLFDSWVDKSEVSLQATPGGKFMEHWDRGGYQLSWSFRPGRLKLVPAIYFQYYHGFAETLLNYSEEVREFRGGVIF